MSISDVIARGVLHLPSLRGTLFSRSNLDLHEFTTRLLRQYGWARNDGLITTRNDRKGFILFEVMMAFVVLVCAIVVVFQFYRASVHAARYSRQFSRAAALLEERITSREKVGEMDLGASQDTVLGPIVWEQERIPGEDQAWHFERMTLSWGEGTNGQHLEISSAFLD